MGSDGFIAVGFREILQLKLLSQLILIRVHMGLKEFEIRTIIGKYGLDIVRV